MFPADKHLTARQYPSLRAENRLDPRFKFMVFQRQTDGFRRDDMVIVIIINIFVTIITRGGYDLRIVLKENIPPESNIALNPQFLKELFLYCDISVTDIPCISSLSSSRSFSDTLPGNDK